MCSWCSHPSEGLLLYCDCNLERYSSESALMLLDAIPKHDRVIPLIYGNHFHDSDNRWREMEDPLKRNNFLRRFYRDKGKQRR